MAGLILLGSAGILFALLVQALSWTAPGPRQSRGRIRVAVIGLAGALIVVAIAVAGGILEGVQATAETDANQFGVGYIFAFVALGFPLVAGVLAIGWTAVVNWGTTGRRMLAAVALGLLTGIPAWLGLIFLMVQLENAFHP